MSSSVWLAKIRLTTVLSLGSWKEEGRGGGEEEDETLSTGIYGHQYYHHYCHQ